MIEEEQFWYHYDMAQQHLKTMDKIARQYFKERAIKKYEEMK